MPWGLWLVRIFRHEDIRKKGSGNIGATNVWRVYGRRLGLPAVLLDTLKGFVPALLATKLEGHGVGVLTGGALLVLGLSGAVLVLRPELDGALHTGPVETFPGAPGRGKGHPRRRFWRVCGKAVLRGGRTRLGGARPVRLCAGARPLASRAQARAVSFPGLYREVATRRERRYRAGASTRRGPDAPGCAEAPGEAGGCDTGGR